MWLLLLLAQGLAVELEAIAIVDDTVEDERIKLRSPRRTAPPVTRRLSLLFISSGVPTDPSPAATRFSPRRRQGVFQMKVLLSNVAGKKASTLGFIDRC